MPFPAIVAGILAAGTIASTGAGAYKTYRGTKTASANLAYQTSMQKDTAKLIVPSARFRRSFPSISITLEIRSNQVSPFDFIFHTFEFLIAIYPNGSINPLHISHSITREGGGEPLRYRVPIGSPLHLLLLL